MRVLQLANGKGRKIGTCVAVVTAWIVLASAAGAADIHSNPITGTDTANANPFTSGQSNDANITVTGIGHGSGVNAAQSSNRYSVNAWTTASSLSATEYFTWTLTPNSGYEIDFTSLAGQWQRSNAGPDAYALRSSLDNFAADIATGSITNPGSAEPYSLNLTASTLQNIPAAIEFRLFAWHSGGGTGTFSINDFTFDGTVSLIGGEDDFPGDYNDDTVVDAADYVVWRIADENGATSLPNETASLGDIDEEDYGIWRANFGNEEPPDGTAALQPAGAAVPEPSSVALLWISLASANRRSLARRFRKS